jgi:hypothetical protein
MTLGKKYDWLAKIIFGAYFLIGRLISWDHGIVPPGNVKAIGYDLLTLFIYGAGLYLLYAGVRDFRGRKIAHK